MDSCLWRTSGVLYFLLTFIRAVTSFDVSSIFCDYLYMECCRKPQIEFNRTSFTNDLAKLHGQPFASSIVPRFLGSHVYLTNGEMDPICFYFHGGTGTGKTFLTSLIIKNIYKYGTSSKYVKFFHLGKDYFQDEERTSTIKLWEMIYREVLWCPDSLFVFDGYSECWFKIIASIFNLKKYFVKAIFIFIGNSNSQEMHTYMRKKQNLKNAMHYEDLLDGAKKENPSLKYANFVYVPFLPMQREDVRQCISDRLDELKVAQKVSTKEEVIREVTDLIDFTSDIAISGCRKVADKTALILAQYKSRHEL